MKKIISLIAIVVTFCLMTTNAFAFSCAGQVTGATLKDVTAATATVEYDAANADGFVFKFIADTNMTGGTTTVDVSKLTAAGWTIEAVDGIYAFQDGYTLTNTTSKLSVKFASGQGEYDCAGKAVIQFKAVPSADATIDGVVFTVQPMFNVGGLYNQKVTYTLAEAAPQEDKTTATIAANGEVTFDYADADVADAKLDDKKVVLSKTAVAGNEITADTTVKVTYTPVEGAAETKTFGETLFSYLDAEGFGFLETESITFGVVCDANMSGTFTFALN